MCWQISLVGGTRNEPDRGGQAPDGSDRLVTRLLDVKVPASRRRAPHTSPGATGRHDDRA